MDTAHQRWNETWKSPEGRLDWSTPEADVVACAQKAYETGARRALDLGWVGIGRHALALATLGFDVDALDGSESGLANLQRSAGDLGLAVRGHRAAGCGW